MTSARLIPPSEPGWKYHRLAKDASSPLESGGDEADDLEKNENELQLDRSGAQVPFH